MFRTKAQKDKHAGKYHPASSPPSIGVAVEPRLSGLRQPSESELQELKTVEEPRRNTSRGYRSWEAKEARINRKRGK